MTKLVDDLLFLARADSQQQTLEKKQFSLNAAFRAVIESFKLLAESHGILLESSLDSEVTYRGDEFERVAADHPVAQHLRDLRHVASDALAAG